MPDDAHESWRITEVYLKCFYTFVPVLGATSDILLSNSSLTPLLSMDQSSPLCLSLFSRFFQQSVSTQLIQTLGIFSWPHPISYLIVISQDFPGGSGGKASAYNVGDQGSIPGLGRSPGEGNGNPLQQSYLENPMDEGAWQATVHGVTRSRTRLNDFTSLHRLHVSVTCPQVENLKAGVATGFVLTQCQLHRR